MGRKHIREDKEAEIVGLVTAKAKAEQQLKQRVSVGRDLSGRQISSQQEFELFKKGYRAWNNYNNDLLKRLFSTTEISIEYARFQTRQLFMRPYGYESNWRDDF